jgi:3-oxoacyl-[acyl-carrier-protein] synthase II
MGSLEGGTVRKPRRVVITGLGVVAPNGIGKDAFWDALVAGKSGIDYINAFDPSPHTCHVAGEVKDFRPSEFMSAPNVKVMGRFSQLAVAATRLALLDAKVSITPDLSGHTAICLGTSVAGLQVAVEGVEDFTSHGPGVIKRWTALEYPPHAAASYLAIELDITGPAITISSNCCTGIDTLNAATQQIVSGQAEMAIAASADAPIFPIIFDAFCTLGALTKRNDDPKRASRPYDLLRDGLVLAEGSAALIVEELNRARDRGATIYAEVLGHNAASEALGMRKGDLSGRAMAATIRSAIRCADLRPEDIDHINAHGSSLPDFDICDTRAFKLALGDSAYRIPISSIKSMIGQPVSAAGLLQTAAACLSLRDQRVPPTINQEVRDPHCDLDYVPNWSRSARIRYALINGHSFGGSVSALVIGQPRQ